MVAIEDDSVIIYSTASFHFEHDEYVGDMFQPESYLFLL
jgi:hypothetical protein